MIIALLLSYILSMYKKQKWTVQNDCFMVWTDMAFLSFIRNMEFLNRELFYSKVKIS